MRLNLRYPAKGGTSKVLECGFFVSCTIEREGVNIMPQYFWGHLNGLKKVSALKLSQSRLWQDILAGSIEG